MSDRKVEKGQVYLSNEDRQRLGRTRTVTIERTVMAKRVYDKKAELYAVGVSRIDAAPDRQDLVGKKRRVFVKVSRLLSWEYALTDPLGITAAAPDQIPTPAEQAPHADSFGAPLPVPAPWSEAA